MIKLMLFLVFGIGSGLMLLSQKRRNARAVSHSKDLARISSLENFDFDSLKDVLDTLIRRKIFAGEINTGVLDAGFIKTNAPVPILEKFKIKTVNKSAGNEFLVIADARSNDVLPTRSGNTLVDKFYPASLLVVVEKEKNEAASYSVFPEDKEHEYILKEFSDALFSLMEKQEHAA